MYDVNRAYKLLEKISFERLGGSKEELKAAEIIKEEIEKNGVEAHFEEFEVDHAVVNEVSFEVVEPFKKKYNVTGIMMSGSTSDEGIVAPFVYIEDANEANLLDVEGKIVLFNGRMMHKAYKKLVEKKVAGFIAISGSIYDEEDKSDLDEWALREPQYSQGKIPGIAIRAKDAQELIVSNPKTVKIVLKQEEGKAVSRNVVCEIKGSEYPNQVIAMTAHYDSVRFSTGAYDNASGSVGIMELFYHFLANKPKRTIKFVWCGSEEMGLLGSKAFVKQHEEEIKNYVYCLNVDMIGVVLGKEIAVSTAENSLASYISYVGNEIGIAVSSTQGVYSSDSTPFADAGVPSTSFARISPMGGARIHSRKDIIETMTAEAFDSSLKLMVEFANRVINSVVFPIPRSIPDNMKAELDFYNLRKERPSK